MNDQGLSAQDGAGRPASRPRVAARPGESPWPVGQSIRGALALGLPWALCFAAGAPMAAMWITFGALRALISESGGDYRTRLRMAVAGATIGAAGFLAGFLDGLPWAATVAAMSAAGFVAAVLSSHGAMLSVGATQALLVACLAIGLPGAAVGWAPLLYLGGVALYAALLAIEMLRARRGRRDDATADPLARPGLAAPAPAAAPDPSPPLRRAARRIARRIAPGAAAVADGMAPGGAVLRAAAATALCLGLAYAARWLDGSEHWFWIPLTVGLVMKPDLGSVSARAVLRVAGTVVGAAIGAAILVLAPASVWLAAPLALFAGLLPGAARRSFALLAAAVTPVILIVVGSMETGDLGVADGVQRVVDTAIGGAIVLVFGRLLWPKTRLDRLAADLHRAGESVAAHLRALGAGAAADPGPAAARRAARRRLGDLRLRLGAALDGPSPAGEVAAWAPLIAAAGRVCDRVAAYGVAGEGPASPAEAAALARLADFVAAAPDERRRSAPSAAGCSPRLAALFGDVEREMRHMDRLRDASAAA